MTDGQQTTAGAVVTDLVQAHVLIVLSAWPDSRPLLLRGICGRGRVGGGKNRRHKDEQRGRDDAEQKQVVEICRDQKASRDGDEVMISAVWEIARNDVAKARARLGWD